MDELHMSMVFTLPFHSSNLKKLKEERNPQISSVIPVGLKEHLLNIRENNQNLYLLGIQYNNQIGTDIQPVITGTSYLKESTIDLLTRESREEIGMDISDGFYIGKSGEYKTFHIDISNCQPMTQNCLEPKKRSGNGKVCIIITGTFKQILDKILEVNYRSVCDDNPPKHAIIPIDNAIKWADYVEKNKIAKKCKPFRQSFVQ